MGFKRRAETPRDACARIVRECGRAELERIGALVDQLDMGSAPAATELRALSSATGFDALVAVACGADLAAEGDRSSALMHITAGGETDIDVLIGEAEGEVDLFARWERQSQKVAEAVAVAIEAPPESWLFDVMFAAFEYFVRPRIDAAIARHRRES